MSTPTGTPTAWAEDVGPTDSNVYRSGATTVTTLTSDDGTGAADQSNSYPSQVQDKSRQRDRLENTTTHNESTSLYLSTLQPTPINLSGENFLAHHPLFGGNPQLYRFLKLIVLPFSAVCFVVFSFMRVKTDWDGSEDGLGPKRMHLFVNKTDSRNRQWVESKGSGGEYPYPRVVIDERYPGQENYYPPYCISMNYFTTSNRIVATITPCICFLLGCTFFYRPIVGLLFRRIEPWAICLQGLRRAVSIAMEVQECGQQSDEEMLWCWVASVTGMAVIMLLCAFGDGFQTTRKLKLVCLVAAIGYFALGFLKKRAAQRYLLVGVPRILTNSQDQQQHQFEQYPSTQPSLLNWAYQALDSELWITLYCSVLFIYYLVLKEDFFLVSAEARLLDPGGLVHNESTGELVSWIENDGRVTNTGGGSGPGVVPIQNGNQDDVLASGSNPISKLVASSKGLVSTQLKTVTQSQSQSRSVSVAEPNSIAGIQTVQTTQQPSVSRTLTRLTNRTSQASQSNLSSDPSLNDTTGNQPQSATGNTNLVVKHRTSKRRRRNSLGTEATGVSGRPSQSQGLASSRLSKMGIGSRIIGSTSRTVTVGGDRGSQSQSTAGRLKGSRSPSSILPMSSVGEDELDDAIQTQTSTSAAVPVEDSEGPTGTAIGLGISKEITVDLDAFVPMRVQAGYVYPLGGANISNRFATRLLQLSGGLFVVTYIPCVILFKNKRVFDKNHLQQLQNQSCLSPSLTQNDSYSASLTVLHAAICLSLLLLIRIYLHGLQVGLAKLVLKRRPEVWLLLAILSRRFAAVYIEIIQQEGETRKGQAQGQESDQSYQSCTQILDPSIVFEDLPFEYAYPPASSLSGLVCVLQALALFLLLVMVDAWMPVENGAIDDSEQGDNLILNSVQDSQFPDQVNRIRKQKIGLISVSGLLLAFDYAKRLIANWEWSSGSDDELQLQQYYEPNQLQDSHSDIPNHRRITNTIPYLWFYPCTPCTHILASDAVLLCYVAYLLFQLVVGRRIFCVLTISLFFMEAEEDG